MWDHFFTKVFSSSNLTIFASFSNNVLKSEQGIFFAHQCPKVAPKSGGNILVTT